MSHNNQTDPARVNHFWQSISLHLTWSDCYLTVFHAFRSFREEEKELFVPIDDQLMHNASTYGSPLFLYFIIKGIRNICFVQFLFLRHALVRLKSSDYKKEQAALSEPDEWADIHLDKSRVRHYKGTDIGRRMEELGQIIIA